MKKTNKNGIVLKIALKTLFKGEAALLASDLDLSRASQTIATHLRAKAENTVKLSFSGVTPTDSAVGQIVDGIINQCVSNQLVPAKCVSRIGCVEVAPDLKKIFRVAMADKVKSLN
jgi:hypothetical protein